MRIVTVTANAALDRTWFVDQLQPGRRHQVRETYASAGGKGVNVARVLRALGADVTAIVLVGGETGQRIRADLERSAIPAIPVEADGESRTCLEVIECSTGAITQLHETGVSVDARTCERLRDTIVASARDATWVALCGSLADGLSPDSYGDWISACRAAGARVALDASGPALVNGIAASPDLLRINREEAAEVGLHADHLLTSTWTDVLRRVSMGIISAGSAPSIAWCDGRLQTARPPTVAVRSPIGCGDAMLAGLLHRGLEPTSFAVAVRRAVALASAGAESAVAGRPDLGRAAELEPLVIVRDSAVSSNARL